LQATPNEKLVDVGTMFVEGWDFLERALLHCPEQLYMNARKPDGNTYRMCGSVVLELRRSWRNKDVMTAVGSTEIGKQLKRLGKLIVVVI